MKLMLFIVTSVLLLMIILWYTLSLNKDQRVSRAKEELQYLFSEDHIDTSLFKGPVSILEGDKVWFQWAYNNQQDSLIIRIYVPKFRILETDHYMLGKDTLWNKVYKTESRYSKTKSE